jgi:hypothetical protein
MMSRRNALLAGIGLAGIAAYARNVFALGAHASVEKFDHERKCIAGAAVVTSATCSTTGRNRLGSATA